MSVKTLFREQDLTRRILDAAEFPERPWNGSKYTQPRYEELRSEWIKSGRPPVDTFKPIVEIRKKWLAEMRAKVKMWLEAKKTGEVDPQKAARYIKQNRAEIVAAAQDLIKSGLRPSLVPLRAQIAKMKAGPQTPQIQGDIARMEDRLQWLEAKCPPMDKFPPAVERKRVWEQFCRKQYGYIP